MACWCRSGRIEKCPMIMERIKKCKEARENSVAAGIRKFAATPTLLHRELSRLIKILLLCREYHHKQDVMSLWDSLKLEQL